MVKEKNDTSGRCMGEFITDRFLRGSIRLYVEVRSVRLNRASEWLGIKLI